MKNYLIVRLTLLAVCAGVTGCKSDLQRVDLDLVQSERLKAVEKDPRVPIDDASVPMKLRELSRAVARLDVEMGYEGKTVRSQATGVLVAPDLLLTAAHVVYDGKPKQMTAQYYFADEVHVSVKFGYAATRSLQERTVKATHAIDMQFDWALLELDKPVEGIEPLSLFPGDYEDIFPWDDEIDEPAYERKAVFMGYNSDEAIGKSSEVLTVDPHFEIDNVSKSSSGHGFYVSYPGSSGGPILILEDGRYLLVGIHRRSSGDPDLTKRSANFVKIDRFSDSVRAWLKKEQLH